MQNDLAEKATEDGRVLKEMKSKYKINSGNRLPRSQSTMLVKHISKIDEDDEESDFKVNESVYSGVSFDSVYSWEYDETLEDHFEFEIRHYKSKPHSLINDIFNKLDMFEKIREDTHPNQVNKLANYLQSKVSKMQREYLELLFMMLFENISKKDKVIEMIAKGQTQNHVNKKVYKTVIQPKFEVIPFNVRSIENILNKAYIVDNSGKVKVKERKE